MGAEGSAVPAASLQTALRAGSTASNGKHLQRQSLSLQADFSTLKLESMCPHAHEGAADATAFGGLIKRLVAASRTHRLAHWLAKY